MNNDGYITIVSMIIPLFMELYKENKMKDVIIDANKIMMESKWIKEKKGFRDVLVSYIKNEIVDKMIMLYIEKCKMRNGIRKYSEEKKIRSMIEKEVWSITIDDNEEGIIDYYTILDVYDSNTGRIEMIVVNS